MRRRSLVATSLAFGLLPSRARSQSAGATRRLAIIHPVLPVARMTAAGSTSYRALFEELRRQGHVEGATLTVDRYSTEGRAERLDDTVREVVRRQPDVVFTTTAPVARAMHATSKTIPIVAITSDPVAMGFAASLARPGGNVTGVSIDGGLEILGKRVQLLRELVPGIHRLAYLSRAASWDQPDGRFLRAFCAGIGVALVPAPLRGQVDDGSFRAAFEGMAAERADAVLVAAEAENRINARPIIEGVTRARLPAIYDSRDYPEAGGLVSYGIDFADAYRMIAGSIGRVLAGARPADIPFLQPTKFELVLNLNAARHLGVPIATAFQVRADEVIE